MCALMLVSEDQSTAEDFDSVLHYAVHAAVAAGVAVVVPAEPKVEHVAVAEHPEQLLDSQLLLHRTHPVLAVAAASND